MTIYLGYLRARRRTLSVAIYLLVGGMLGACAGGQEQSESAGHSGTTQAPPNQVNGPLDSTQEVTSAAAADYVTYSSAEELIDIADAVIVATVGEIVSRYREYGGNEPTTDEERDELGVDVLALRLDDVEPLGGASGWSRLLVLPDISQTHYSGLSGLKTGDRLVLFLRAAEPRDALPERHFVAVSLAQGVWEVRGGRAFPSEESFGRSAQERGVPIEEIAEQARERWKGE